MPSLKDYQERDELAAELRAVAKEREGAFAAIEKARKMEAQATVKLAEVEGSFMEARERMEKLLSSKFDGEDPMGFLDMGGPKPGSALARARSVAGEPGEDSSRGPRGEIQPAISEALSNSDQGMTNADLQAAVSDRLGRQVNPGSLNQALQAMLKNKSIRRTGKRRSFLYWPVSDGEVSIKPGEELDRDAQARLAELRTEE